MIPQVQTTVNSYDRIAPYYLQVTGGQQEARQIAGCWVDRFLNALVVPGLPILDLGCGDGRDLELLMSHGVFGIGVDLSSMMLSYARKRLPRGLLVRMDASSWAFKRRRFCGVWASGILYHFPREILVQVLNSIRQSLIPSGVFYFNYLIGSGEGMDQSPLEFGGFPRYYAHYQPQEISKLLSGFGILYRERQSRNGFQPDTEHVLAASKR